MADSATSGTPEAPEEETGSGAASPDAVDSRHAA